MPAGLCHLNNEATARRTQAPVMPEIAVAIRGLNAAGLMACIEVTLCAAGRRPRPFITKAEKAKKPPAISPQLSAEINVKEKSRLLIIWGSLESLLSQELIQKGRWMIDGEFSERCWLATDQLLNCRSNLATEPGVADPSIKFRQPFREIGMGAG